MTDQAEPKWPARPYDPETVRRAMEYMQVRYTIAPEVIEPGIKGVIIGALNKICMSDSQVDKSKKERGDARRHLLLGWLFGDPNKILKAISSKQLTDAQWYALYKWIAPSRSVDAKWYPHPAFENECIYSLNAALRQQHKQNEQFEIELGFDKEMNT